MSGRNGVRQDLSDEEDEKSACRSWDGRHSEDLAHPDHQESVGEHVAQHQGAQDVVAVFAHRLDLVRVRLLLVRAAVLQHFELHRVQREHANHQPAEERGKRQKQHRKTRL